MGPARDVSEIMGPYAEYCSSYIRIRWPPLVGVHACKNTQSCEELNHSRPSRRIKVAKRNRTDHMTKGLRQTSCPLCRNALGAMIGGQWVPMPLDEYREHVAGQLSRAKGLPQTCVACGMPPPLGKAQALLGA